MPLVGIGTPPQPPTRRLVCHLPPVSGGRGTLAGEKGDKRVPFPTRGIHCGTLYMYVLCGSDGSGSKSIRIWKGRICSVSFLAPLHCYKGTGYCFLWTYVSGGTIRGRRTESSWQKSEWILLNEIWMFYLEIMRYGINSLYLVTCVTADTLIQYIVCKYILLKFSLVVEFFLLR
jgi:hypothetical protein